MHESDPGPPFAPYGGPDPYLFVSYSHEDRATVYPEILRLHQEGFRLWYDEGIGAGREWPEEIARRLEGAAAVLYFISPHFVRSRNCRNEVNFALDRDKALLAVHLEDTELPPGLSLQVGSIQALRRHRLSPEAFESKLGEALQSFGARGSSPPAAATPSPPALRRPKSSGAWRWLLASATIVVAAWLYLSLLGDRPTQPAPEAGSTAVEQAPALDQPIAELHLAVMSIEDATGDEALAQAGISSILSDAFVQLLDGSEGARVVSPVRLDSVLRQLGRSFEETGGDLDLARAVCHEAGANLLLTGSLSRLGESFVLSARLTELPSERLVGSYQAQVSGVQQLLDAPTTQIAEHLRESVRTTYDRELGGATEVGQVATSDLEAYASFIRGLDHSWEGRWPAAIDELQTAVELDPEMALAWSQLGCAFSFAGDSARSQAAQRRAEQLSDRLGAKEAHFVRCKSLWIEGAAGERFVACEEDFVERYPDERDGYLYAGFGERWLNHRCEPALPWYEKAYELTPTYYPISKEIAECHEELGDPELGIAALQRYLEVERSGHGHEQARAQLERLRSSSGDRPTG